jgi:hypothetical protein
MTPEDRELLRELRPLVVRIVAEMCAVGGKSPGELTRWQRLVRAVRDEMLSKGDLDAAVERIVGEKLGERIAWEVEAFMRNRWTEEMRTFQLLEARGEIYLRIKEAARIASCCERTINRILDSGELPTYYLVNDPRIKLADLRKYLAGERPVEPDGAVDSDAGGVEPDEGASREPESSGEHAR